MVREPLFNPFSDLAVPLARKVEVIENLMKRRVIHRLTTGSVVSSLKCLDCLEVPIQF
jgi:hypothetical protein